MHRSFTTFLLVSFLAACGGDDAPAGPSGAGGAGAGGGGGGEALPSPDPQLIPAPTGACPEFVDGTQVEFQPAGINPRLVRIFVGPDPQAQDGPFVIYWHGSGSIPMEANIGLGAATIEAIKAEGGVVVAPTHDPEAGQFPWFLTAGSGREDDILLTDEILACAIEKVGIDLRRIHSSGMSAGGLQTVQLSYRRSGYMASVAPYSGGLLGMPPQQEDANKFAAMIFHGGPTDVVIVEFQPLSEAYRDDLRAKGHFAFLCDHGLGHTIPMDAQASLWAFFQSHPYGAQPSPYEQGLPADFPSYCSL